MIAFPYMIGTPSIAHTGNLAPGLLEGIPPGPHILLDTIHQVRITESYLSTTDSGQRSSPAAG
jgi:hypothetical protein